MIAEAEYPAATIVFYGPDDCRATKAIVATDGIIGCPHEAGKDYPGGMKCPLWPFWSRRDHLAEDAEK